MLPKILERMAQSQPTRRQVLIGASATGAALLIGFKPFGASAVEPGMLADNAFVRIDANGWVTVLAKHFEMGQGTYTGLATLVAEELDADWTRVRTEGAPANAQLYKNFLFGVQGTGGSTAMANSFEQYRKAGAAARAVLVEAAAAAWGVPAADIRVENGVVLHTASGRSGHYGEFIAAAAKLAPPFEVKLKDPKDFKLIGKALPRKDTAAKTTGQAQFTMDVTRPGMLTALVAHSPRFGATVGSVDDKAARAIRGVVDVVQIPQGVAVLANGFWPAKQGRDALVITWNEDRAEKRGSDELIADFAKRAEGQGLPARRDGDAAVALSQASQTISAQYVFPYLAHTPMEPLDCVVELKPNGVEIWAGSQLQTVDQMVAASIAGVRPEDVIIHTLYAGGSFGRRATASADAVAEAVSIAKAINGRAPVKLLWTREDDLTGGKYRPLAVHKATLGLDASGAITGWSHHIVAQSIIAGTPFAAMMKDGIDPTATEGVADSPYAIPNFRVDLTMPEVGVPVLWWRSVGHTHTAFVMETLMDRAAKAAGKDPVEFRRALLSKHPRHLGVLNLVAEKAGWGTPLPAGTARGIAVHESFKSFVAQVAEVRLDGRGGFVVERVVCAVDCGLAINPDVIRAQVEGGIGYGLSAALAEEITLTDGVVDQANWDSYTLLRINQMPKIEVHIVASGEAPTGIGEPGLPPIAPAIANALFALTGKPVERLPFARSQFLPA